nr:MAG: hypothetical protein AM325_00605 [Candidatus Thorarchaeota archaeon SMTZ1-45]
MPCSSHIKAQSNESNLLTTLMLTWETILGCQTSSIILWATTFPKAIAIVWNNMLIKLVLKVTIFREGQCRMKYFSVGLLLSLLIPRVED